MDTPNQVRLDLFINNASAAKKGFVWKNTMIRRLAALLYTAENRSIDIDAIRGCNTRIKENTGVFSTFRGNSSLGIATLLSLSADPDRLLNDTLTVYDLMKKAGFWRPPSTCAHSRASAHGRSISRSCCCCQRPWSLSDQQTT